jgi:hypothetical protein
MSNTYVVTLTSPDRNIILQRSYVGSDSVNQAWLGQEIAEAIENVEVMNEEQLDNDD